jgi:hypothetical protein
MTRRGKPGHSSALDGFRSTRVSVAGRAIASWHEALFASCAVNDSGIELRDKGTCPECSKQSASSSCSRRCERCAIEGLAPK